MNRHKRQAVQPPEIWTRFENARAGHPDDPLTAVIEAQPGYVGHFVNSLYQVEMRETVTQLGETTWLVIRRRDSEPVYDWRHLQRIKNELCGPEREALEIFPAESRLVDTSNQYHLFVLAEGFKVPLGYQERDVSDIPFGKNKNRPFEDPPKDLNARGKEIYRVPIFGRLGRS